MDIGSSPVLGNWYYVSWLCVFKLIDALLLNPTLCGFTPVFLNQRSFLSFECLLPTVSLIYPRNGGCFFDSAPLARSLALWTSVSVCVALFGLEKGLFFPSFLVSLECVWVFLRFLPVICGMSNRRKECVLQTDSLIFSFACFPWNEVLFSLLPLEQEELVFSLTLSRFLTLSAQYSEQLPLRTAKACSYLTCKASEAIKTEYDLVLEISLCMTIPLQSADLRLNVHGGVSFQLGQMILCFGNQLFLRVFSSETRFLLWLVAPRRFFLQFFWGCYSTQSGRLCKLRSFSRLSRLW